MAKPKTIHTFESLMDMTIEEGDCRLWDKYLGNGVPMVYHDGKLIQVRKLILTLQGVDVWAKYTAAKCNNPLCVEPDHIIQRSPKQQYIHIGKRLSFAPSNQARIAKITKACREASGKLTQEQAIEIRMSDESGPVLSERYGIDRSMVSRIKRGKNWAMEFGNPFAGLGMR